MEFSLVFFSLLEFLKVNCRAMWILMKIVISKAYTHKEVFLKENARKCGVLFHGLQFCSLLISSSAETYC
jgi:hypothetical protein